MEHPRNAGDFEIDEGNESELAAHGITPTEAIQVLLNDPEWVRNKKGRAGVWKAVGRTDGGRVLSIPIMYDAARGVVRPVTGWDATPGEKTRYLRG